MSWGNDFCAALEACRCCGCSTGFDRRAANEADDSARFCCCCRAEVSESTSSPSANETCENKEIELSTPRSPVPNSQRNISAISVTSFLTDSKHSKYGLPIRGETNGIGHNPSLDWDALCTCSIGLYFYYVPN